MRVANLALQSSGEGVETLERYVARTASAYGIAVDVVVLPEQIILREKAAENVSNLAVVRATPGWSSVWAWSWPSMPSLVCSLG